MNLKIDDEAALSLQRQGEEFARLNPDGSVVIKWDILRECAAEFDPNNYETGAAVARLVWEATNPGVKP